MNLTVQKSPHHHHQDLLTWPRGARRTVAVPFLNSRVHWFGLVYAGIPENLETLLRAVSFRIKRSVHPVYDFLIRATLEGDRLALVVESEVKI